MWTSPLRFPHYIPLFEKESTGLFRTLVDRSAEDQLRVRDRQVEWQAARAGDRRYRLACILQASLSPPAPICGLLFFKSASWPTRQLLPWRLGRLRQFKFSPETPRWLPWRFWLQTPNHNVCFPATGAPGPLAPTPRACSSVTGTGPIPHRRTQALLPQTLR